MYSLGLGTHVCREAGVEDVTDTHAGAGTGIDRCVGYRALLE